MSKLITIESLTKIRQIFRENNDINSVSLLIKNFPINFGIQTIDATEYPSVTQNLLNDFYGSFEANSKDEFALAKILYEGLTLNRAQAANNQYWVYLNLHFFKDYIIRRWCKLNEDDPDDFNMKDIDRYFLALEPSQNTLIKSPIAGLWWSIELTIDSGLNDPYYYSKLFLSERNFRDKNMGPYQLIRHRNIFQAMLDFHTKYKDTVEDNDKIGSEAIAQQMSKTINQIGGLTLLSYLSKQEVTDILEQHKKLILKRATEVKVNKIVSKEKIQAQNKTHVNTNHAAKIIKYFNISNSGEYGLRDFADTQNFEFSCPILETERQGFMMFCYNEEGNINRVDISSILKKNRTNYINGVYHGNTINNIITSIDENDIIGELIYRGGEYFFKGHKVSLFKANNGNVGLSGYKTMYESYNSISYFHIPASYYHDVERLVPLSFTAQAKSLKNNTYKKEWELLRTHFSNFFPD